MTLKEIYNSIDNFAKQFFVTEKFNYFITDKSSCNPESKVLSPACVFFLLAGLTSLILTLVSLPSAGRYTIDENKEQPVFTPYTQEEIITFGIMEFLVFYVYMVIIMTLCAKSCSYIYSIIYLITFTMLILTPFLGSLQRFISG